MQVLYLGRALCTKETLPDFLKWRRVTRHPLVFRGLTGSQRTPGVWGVTVCLVKLRLESFTAWKLEHISRGSNERADALATMVASLLIKETIFLHVYY